MMLFAAVAAWATTAGVVGVINAAITVFSLASSVYGTVAARRKAKHAMADQVRAYNASLTERSAVALREAPPWRVIYGEAIVGGDVMAMFTSDKTGYKEDGSTYTKPDALKHLVVTVASHEVEDIVEMFIEGVAVGALDGNGWATTGEFYSANKPAYRTATIGGGGYVDVSPAVLAVINGSTLAGSGLDQYSVPFTPTLSLGNTRISGPVGGLVSYTIATSAGKVRWSKHLGSASQTVDTYLNGVKPSQWTTNHRLRGRAYVVVTLDLEEPRFQGGPPLFTFKVKGKKLYDPRSATTGYSRNPALCIRDYITAPYGLGCSTAEIDDASVIAAANACDASITFQHVVGGVSSPFTAAKYTCNGAIISSGDDKERILDDLCMSMAGTASYGAAWSLHAGVWTAPVMTLNDDDLHGQIEIVQAGASIDDLFNGVRGQIIESGSGSPSDFTPYQNTTFVSDDGQELWVDFAFPFTDHRSRAKNIARILVERARQSLVIKYPAKLKAWPVQVGDRVTVNSTEYGFASKTFRVTPNWSFSLEGAVVLTLQEDVAAVYDQADAAVSDDAPNTALPSPWFVAAITGLSALSDDTTAVFGAGNRIIPRVKVSWTQATSQFVKESGGKIEVSWRRTTGTWNTQEEPGDSTSTYIVGPNNSDVITISVRARNSFGQWSDPAFVSCTVSGAHRVVTVSDRYDNVIIGDGSTLPASWTSRDGFFDDFQKAASLSLWERISGSGELSLQTVSDGDGGGFALRVGNNSGDDQAWIVHRGMVPNDPNALYRFTVRARRLSGTGTFYAGFAGVASDGSTLVNVTGADTHSSQHYVCANAAAPASWTIYTGYIKGRAATGGGVSTDPSTPTKAQSNVRWMRPLLICGYNGATGQYEVDYFKIERVEDWYDALTTAEAAQATADGKIVTFWQASAPGSASEGDIWFDTDDGYRQYRRTGGAWVVAADTRIGTAISNAATAQATADGKVVTFVQTSTPTAEGVGDLWFDSDDGYKLYRWNGSSWVAYQYGTSALAAESATAVLSTTTTSDTNSLTLALGSQAVAATVEITAECTFTYTGGSTHSGTMYIKIATDTDSSVDFGVANDGDAVCRTAGAGVTTSHRVTTILRANLSAGSSYWAGVLMTNTTITPNGATYSVKKIVLTATIVKR